MLKLFDFECKRCKIIEEHLVKDKEKVHCPRCGKTMRKKLSAPPFHLKGSGWAKDNYGLKKQEKKKDA